LGLRRIRKWQPVTVAVLREALEKMKPRGELFKDQYDFLEPKENKEMAEEKDLEFTECGTCGAWELKHNECRRHAPIRLPDDPGAQTVVLGHFHMWPVTNEDDWCQEWMHNERI
jgi:hypothetical protein